MNKYMILSIFFVFTSAFVTAQIESVGMPLSHIYDIDFSEINASIELEYFDNTVKFNKETNADDTIPKLEVIGVGRPIDKNFIEESQSFYFDDKVVSFLRIKSNGARSIRLVFSEFSLTGNSKVYVHYPDISPTYFRGAYTHKNETKSGMFAVRFGYGDEIIIELNTTIDSLNKNRLHVDFISHGFDDCPGTGFNQSGPCNNNVNCEEWDEWCKQIRSAVAFEYDAPAHCFDNCPGATCSSRCSGALVNNYEQDFHPYVLTAQHCTDCDIFWDGAIIILNMQSPFCENTTATNRYSVDGGINLLASCKKTDVALIEARRKVPEQYNAYFAGYDTRKKNDMPTDNVVGIHHPCWDYKKISKGDWNTGILASHWKVCWTDGIMEPGSSGAPIFEEETKRIVGVHSMGKRSLNCDDEGDFCKWIGKLRHCWHDGGIEQYLGKGIATVNLDGADPILACQENIELDGIFRDARDYRNERHQITIQANNNIVISENEDSEFFTQSSVYSSSTVPNPQPNFIIQAGSRIEISGNHTTRINEGSIVRLTTAPCIYTEEECGFNYFAKKGNENTIEEKLFEEISNNSSKTYPNPFSSTIQLEFTLVSEEKITAHLYNLQGQKIQQFMENKVFDTGNHKLNLDVIQELSKGIYIFEFCINGACERKQLIKD